MIYLGTSGFSYNDWVGPVYPVGMPRKEWLSYYAREFLACEVNATYYAIPSPSILQGMARRTPDGFRFAVKAHQSITHNRDADDATYDAFLRAQEPLAKAGKLGCVLLQFPTSFKPSVESRDYMLSVRERLQGLPLVVEFRRRDWVRDEVLDWLREHGLGFCCVDEPLLRSLMPPIAAATSDIAYVRFHGRNAQKWFHHQQPHERYDYLYSLEELQGWVPKIQGLASRAQTVYLFANNHWQGKAVDTMRKLKALLENAGMEVAASAVEQGALPTMGAST